MKKRNKQYNTDGIYSQLYHLIEILLEKTYAYVPDEQKYAHQHDIFTLLVVMGHYHHSFHNFLQK